MTGPRESSHELENLAGLLRDFGTDGWTPERTDDAFAEIAARSLRLESFYEEDARFVADFSAPPERMVPLHRLMEAIGRSVHLYLFKDILRTAGRYRSPGDPDGGFVAFGGAKGQTTRPLFHGTPAADIPQALNAAYRRLEDLRDDAHHADASVQDDARARATASAVLFYKDFSSVHPFYDANGRSGRYVVSVYLLLHGLYVRWSALDESEAKFLKRINECLKRRGHADSSVLDKYEGYLVQFWRSFVEPIPDDEAPSTLGEAEE